MIHLLFQRATIGKIGDIELDAKISENHNFRNVVTRFPVESGALISDHIINEPEVITMVGFITNSPVKLGGRIGQFVVDSLKKKPNTGSDRVKTAFTMLTDLREIKEPFDVVTGLKTYRQMVFQSIDIPRDARTGDTLRFTATMTRIPKVSAKTVEIQNLAQNDTGTKGNTKDTASNKVDKAKQPTSKATENQEVHASWVLQLSRGAGKSGAELIDAAEYLFQGGAQ